MSPLAPALAAEQFPVSRNAVRTLPLEPPSSRPRGTRRSISRRSSMIVSPKFSAPVNISRRARAFASLAMPSQGSVRGQDTSTPPPTSTTLGLRRVAAAGGGKITLPNGVPFVTPGMPDAANIIFTSQWDNYPRSVRIPLERSCATPALAGGRINESHAEPVRQRRDRGRLPGWNPGTPADAQPDQLVADRPGLLHRRFSVPQGSTDSDARGSEDGAGACPGSKTSSRAWVAWCPAGRRRCWSSRCSTTRTLRALTVTALANEVVVGLMSATLVR